jgi:hypothetical protein
MIEPENRVEFVLGERPISRGYRAEDIRVEVDLIECDGVVEAIVKFLSHRSTSSPPALAPLSLTGYGHRP